MRGIIEKLTGWIVAQLPFAQVLRGYKRQIGFLMWALGYLIQGLTIAANFFPQTSQIPELIAMLTQLNDQATELLKTLGISVMVIGVADHAVYDKAEKPKKK